MTLTAGDFFAGTYQLREPLPGSESKDSAVVRWRADDYSANRQEEVVLDVMSQDYDEALNWLIEVPGLRKVGQTASPAARFFAWEPGKVQPLSQFDYHQASAAERQDLAELIEQLHVAAHETIDANDMPEFWRTRQNDWVVFYRKHHGQATSHKEKQAIRKLWIENLSRPAITIEPIQVAEELEDIPKPKENPRWPLLLIGASIILFGLLYMLSPVSSSSSRVAFDRAIERGVIHAKKGEYEVAVEAFKVAASAPQSDELDLRLDSLARGYEALARRECERYQSTESTNLYFIPNQYFQYTAILNRWPEPEVCK